MAGQLYFSEFEPILIKIDKVPILKFRLKKKKGEVENLDLNFKGNMMTYELYVKAKNLKSTQQIPSPYWNIYNLISPLPQLSDKVQYNKRDEFTRVWLDEISKPLSMRKLDIESLYTDVTGNLNYYYRDIFTNYLAKNKDALFIFSVLFMSPVEEYINRFPDNKINCLELPFFVSREKNPTSEEMREEFLREYPDVNYKLIIDNICDINKLNFKIDKKVDNVFININHYIWIVKKYNSYINSQVLFNMLLFSFKNLNKGGSLIMDIGELTSPLLLDIITILGYFFKESYLYRTPLANNISPYKKVIAKGFQGLNNIELEEMTKISIDWNKISKKCTTDFIFWDEEEYYVSSIADYEKDYYYVKEYHRIEHFKKVKFFLKIIYVYYGIQLFGDYIIKETMEQKLANLLHYLKINGINTKLPYKNLNNQMMKNDLLIDFDKIKDYYIKEDPEIKLLYNTGSYEVKNLEDISFLFRSTQKYTSYLNQGRLSDIEKLTNKLWSLENYIYEKSDLDINYEFLKFYEILRKFNLIGKRNKFYCDLIEGAKAIKYFSQAKETKDITKASLIVRSNDEMVEIIENIKEILDHNENGELEEVNFIIKSYLTYYNNSNINLIFFLSHCFDKVYFHYSVIEKEKEAIYLVCKGLRRIEKHILKSLSKRDLDTQRKLFKINSTFLEKYSDVISHLEQKYTEILFKQIYYYDNSTALEETKRYESYIEKNIENWIKYYQF